MARNLVPFLPLFAIMIGALWREYAHALPDWRLVAGVLVAAVVTVPLVVRLVTGAWAAVSVGQHRRRLEALAGLAAGLQDGRHDGRGFYGDGVSVVSGVRRGRRVRLVLQREEVALEAWVHHPVAAWHLTRPALPEPLRRALRLPGARASWRVEAQQGLAPGELEQAAVERALRRLFREHGATSVTLQEGVLRVARPLRDEDMSPARLDEAFAQLEALAVMFDRRELVVRAVRGKSYGWTGGTGALRCPYCRDGISLEDQGLAPCGACRTLHHVDCLDEAGGCTVMGCEGGPSRESARRSRDSERQRGVGA